MAKVYIDAGHGGKDPGAIGCGKVHEADINLIVAKHLEAELKRNGHTVKMCRTTDITKELDERTTEANKWGADIYFAIHCNAFDQASANGTETFCYAKGGNGEKIAKAVQKELLAVLKTSDRCKDCGGSKEANFYVLRKTTMPAVLTELAFVTNQADCAKLTNADYQKKCAVAICKGICAYLGTTYKTEETNVTTNTKKDNTPSEWSKDAINWAVKEGILQGDTNGDYKLRENVTTERMLVFLYRALK